MRLLSLRWLIPLTLVVLLLPACGDSADDDTGTTAAAEASSTTAPVEVLSEQATSTTEPTTTTLITTTTAPPTTTTTTTEPPTTTTLVLLSDQEWPDLFGRSVERSEPILTTFEEVKTWINGTGYLVNQWGVSAYSTPGGVAIAHMYDEIPPVGERPTAPLIAPALFEASLYMCDEVTKGEDPDIAFAQVVVDWRDYPWPEDKEQSFFLLLAAVSMAGMPDSLCEQNGDVLIGDFLASQLEAIENNNSLHYAGFAHPELLE